MFLTSVMNTRYGRSDRIRTCDLLVPNQAHYQTVPHPERLFHTQTVYHRAPFLSTSFCQFEKENPAENSTGFLCFAFAFYSFSSIKFDNLSIFSSSSSIRKSKSSISSTLISLMASSRCSIRSISSS